MGRIRGLAGPKRRRSCRTSALHVAALVVAAVYGLVGCTYAKEEPGLFGRQASSPAPPTAAPSGTEKPSSSPPPRLRNAELPVVGEAVWTSGDGLAVEVRIAVHAVRRIKGATVLDWSVTPLRGAGLNEGDPVPASVNLGLSRFGEGSTNVFLVNGPGGALYRPLTSTTSAGLESCLCSPIWLAQRHLWIGRTLLLQIAYPELPADLTAVDVDVATVPMFWHVPVTPAGMVPQPTSPVDLGSASDWLPVAATSRIFVYPPGRQQFLVSVERVLMSSTFTSVQWRLQSVTAGNGVDSATSPPLADNNPDDTLNYNPASASAPRILPSGRAAGSAVRARLTTTNLRGLGALECLCSDLRLWAPNMRLPRQQITLVTNMAPLPTGTQLVDVVFPGLTTLKGIRVRQASDAAARSAAPVPGGSRTWTYSTSDPPAGWPVDQWPTPLPKTQQLRSYGPIVDDLVR